LTAAGASAIATAFQSPAHISEPSGKSSNDLRATPLTHHLFKVAVADPIAAIPADRPKDNLTLKMTPLKLAH
jgi:hypothetical protein